MPENLSDHAYFVYGMVGKLSSSEKEIPQAVRISIYDARRLKALAREIRSIKINNIPGEPALDDYDRSILDEYKRRVESYKKNGTYRIVSDKEFESGDIICPDEASATGAKIQMSEFIDMGFASRTISHQVPKIIPPVKIHIRPPK